MEAEMRFLKNLCLNFDLQFTGVNSGYMFDPDPAKDKYLVELLFQIFKLPPENESIGPVWLGRIYRPLSFAFRFIYGKKFNLSMEEVMIGYLMLVRTPYFSAMRSIYKTHSSIFTWSRTDQGLLYLTLPSDVIGPDLDKVQPMFKLLNSVLPDLKLQLGKKTQQVEAANEWIIKEITRLFQAPHLVALHAEDSSQVHHPFHVQHLLDQQPGFNVAAAVAASTQVTAEDSREFILNNRSLIWKLSTSVWNPVWINESFNRFQAHLKVFMLHRIQSKILRRGGQPLEAPEPNAPEQDEAAAPHFAPFANLQEHHHPHVPQEIEFGPFHDYDSEDEDGFLFEAFATEAEVETDGSEGMKGGEEPLWKFSLLPGELELVQEIYHSLMI